MAVKRILFFLWIALEIFGSSAEVFADELHQMYRSARRTAMGGAYIALADDESSIYLNPAGLAGNRESSLHFAPVLLDLSTDSISNAPQLLQVFSNFTLSSLNQVIGLNAYGRAQYAPTLLMGNLGLSIMIDQQLAVYSENQALPQIQMGYQTSYVIQGAYGVSLMGLTGKRRRRTTTDFRLGVGGKLIWRRGGYYNLDISTLFSVTQGEALLNSIVGDFKFGYGVDIGLQFISAISKNLSFSTAAVLHNLGDMDFSSGTTAVDTDFTVGLAARYRATKSMEVVIAADYTNLMKDADWRRKLRMGLEVSLPVISLHAGLNQAYLTYGVAFDLWLFKLSAAAYTEELGALLYQDPDPRYLIQLDFKVNL